jgi:membrane protein
VYSHILDVLLPGDIFFSDHLKSFLSWALFAVASFFILAVMYKFIPGTKVRFKYARKSASLAGLVFTAIQYLYLETQVMVSKQNAVYGVLAAIPLFMIWLNMGWTVILYGAELTYAFQNVDKHRVTVEKLDEMNEDAVRRRKQRLHNTMTI